MQALGNKNMLGSKASPAAPLRLQQSSRVHRRAAGTTAAVNGGSDVILDIQNLKAKITTTGQTILNGVSLTIKEVGVPCLCTVGEVQDWLTGAAFLFPSYNFPFPCPHLHSLISPPLPSNRVKYTPSWARTAQGRVRFPRSSWGTQNMRQVFLPGEEQPARTSEPFVSSWNSNDVGDRRHSPLQGEGSVCTRARGALPQRPVPQLPIASGNPRRQQHRFLEDGSQREPHRPGSTGARPLGILCLCDA
jgi:hypothetical protein